MSRTSPGPRSDRYLSVAVNDQLDKLRTDIAYPDTQEVWLPRFLANTSSVDLAILETVELSVVQVAELRRALRVDAFCEQMASPWLVGVSEFHKLKGKRFATGPIAALA